VPRDETELQYISIGACAARYGVVRPLACCASVRRYGAAAPDLPRRTSAQLRIPHVLVVSRPFAAASRSCIQIAARGE